MSMCSYVKQLKKMESNMGGDNTSSNRAMACLFQRPPYHDVLWVRFRMCWRVGFMCVWTMSKMGACGSSLSRPCQLTHYFMPFCSKMSLRRPCWGGGTSNIYIHSHIPQAFFIQLAVQGLFTPWAFWQSPLLFHSSKSKSDTFIFIWTFQKVLISCVLWFEIEFFF